MSLNSKDPETDRLVRELAEETGESITTTVAIAVRERLLRVRGAGSTTGLKEELRRIAKLSAGLPVLDDRSPEEIVGYDEHGLPS